MRRLFRRGLWETATSAVILLGLFMLMQPFSMTLYSASFATILLGTLAFTVASHLPQ
jgi:hypothetical protein